MPYPTLDDRDYSYTGFQQAQGDNTFPGTQLDNDLDKLHAFADAVADSLQTITAPAGGLASGIVNRAALSSDLQLGLPTPTAWATATEYTAEASAVTINNNLYVCAVSHTSGVFADDLGAGRWSLVAEFETPATPPPNSVDTAAVQDGSITEPKHATGGVSTRALADGAVTPAKVAASFGRINIGDHIATARLRLPAGFLWCAGQAVSRATYADLFDAITLPVTATRSSGSASLTSVSEDMRFFGVVGAVVEGVGVPLGTTITAVSASTITLSSPATSSGTAQVRIMPWGRGDGSSTFNVPDFRGRVSAGRDDMGGTAASRLAFGAQLGGAGGAQTHVLVETELAPHDHDINDTGHAHGITDNGHAHDEPTRDQANGYAAGTVAQGGLGAKGSFTTDIATTGIAINTATTGIDVLDAGGGAAHNNVQPTAVSNRIIFAGV